LRVWPMPTRLRAQRRGQGVARRVVRGGNHTIFFV
jgi:hypothetical protein